MFGHNIGFVLTSNLLVPGVFNVPDLSYNLFFVGQLAELAYRIILCGTIIKPSHQGDEWPFKDDWVKQQSFDDNQLK